MVSRRRNLVPFATQLTVVDGDTDYNTATKVTGLAKNITAGQFGKIWQKTVPAQQEYQWGYGTARFQRNQGFMTFCMGDENAALTAEGELRLVVTNASDIERQVIVTYPTDGLHNPKTASNSVQDTLQVDINQMTPLPVQGPHVRQDSILVIEFRPIATVVCLVRLVLSINGRRQSSNRGMLCPEATTGVPERRTPVAKP